LIRVNAHAAKYAIFNNSADKRLRAFHMEPTITFKGMEASPAVQARIIEKAAKLARLESRILGCHVIIEAPHRRGRQGKVYHVRLDIKVPSGQIVINREPELNHAHEDVYVAIRDAFNAAVRKLEDHGRGMDAHRVKPHAARRSGVVARLITEEGYGFIEANGDEFYFHRDSVTIPWESMTIGTKVHFAEHNGAKGPYASGVTPT